MKTLRKKVKCSKIRLVIVYNYMYNLNIKYIHTLKQNRGLNYERHKHKRR